MKSSHNITLITSIFFLGLSSCDRIEEESQKVSDAIAIQDTLNQAMDKLDQRMKKFDSVFNSTENEEKGMKSQNDNGKNVFKKFEVDSTMKNFTIRVEEYEE